MRILSKAALKGTSGFVSLLCTVFLLFYREQRERENEGGRDRGGEGGSEGGRDRGREGGSEGQGRGGERVREEGTGEGREWVGGTGKGGKREGERETYP